MATSRLSLRILAIAAFLVASLSFSHAIWLRGMGRYLVQAEAPRRADVAVVLAGDATGDRIVRAAELVRQGFTQKVLVSGPVGIYGHTEDELAIGFAVRHGYPDKWFVPFPIKAYSTEEEALAIVPELRKRGARSCLLVTNDYHTRRAGRVYRATAPDVQFHLVAVPDRFFRPDDWWRTRQGRKTFVLEWMKTVAYCLGI